MKVLTKEPEFYSYLNLESTKTSYTKQKFKIEVL